MAGVSPPVGARWFRKCGGMPPSQLGANAPAPSGRYLSISAREELALLRAQGLGVRASARQRGRPPATIYPALWYQRWHAVPIITDWVDWWGRGGIIDELRPRWYRALFGSLETYYEEAFRATSDGLTVISSALAERAMGLGVPEERICRIPGGTFPDEFVQRSREACREHVGLSPSTPILAFSSLDSFLDMDFMMEAFSLIIRQCPDVLLLVTGKTGEAIVALAEKYGVRANLYLTGFMPYADLSWYLGCADVFVLPFPDKIYNRGRWPNKLGDYMCAGRPIVTNPVGDLKALFERSDIGLLADWNAPDFADKIIRLLADRELGARLGDNARRLATTSYNWRNLIGEVETFYSNVLSRRHAVTT